MLTVPTYLPTCKGPLCWIGRVFGYRERPPSRQRVFCFLMHAICAISPLSLQHVHTDFTAYGVVFAKVYLKTKPLPDPPSTTASLPTGTISKDAESFRDFRKTDGWSCIVMLAKYIAVVTIGASFFLMADDEQARQKSKSGQKLTTVDAVYFATSVCTTIGFGDIAPLTGGAKLFMIVYFIFSSMFVTRGIIFELSGIILRLKGDLIVGLIVESTTWVHKADFQGRGALTVTDYRKAPLRACLAGPSAACHLVMGIISPSSFPVSSPVSLSPCSDVQASTDAGRGR